MSKDKPNTASKPSPASCNPYRLSACAMVALILLRLAIGWHFFCEGKKKITYNSVTGEREINVPTEFIFGQAVGPCAEFFKSRLPDFHQWERLLAQPRQATLPTAEEQAKADGWQAAYLEGRKKANKEGKPFEGQIPPTAPYADWAEQILADWRGHLEDVVAIKGLSDEQKAEAAAILQRRQLELADYLGAQSEDMTVWRHELWRLEQAEEQGGANEIPFQIERNAQKRAETSAKGKSWVRQVGAVQGGLFEDWIAIVPKDKAGADSPLQDEISSLLVSSKERTLKRMNLAVTCLIIGVGVLLMLGLFTRWAALGGIVFLLTVMATQPPWIPGASKQFFYYQLVEVAALLVLVATAAGRFGGLDFFRSRCCRAKAPKK